MIINTEYYQGCKRQRAQAFTLVELMVALFIFMVLTAILSSSFLLF
jgi:type II secretory pathway pseudopilin PulG